MDFFGGVQRDIVKITLAVIGAVTLGNAIANPTGTASLIRALTDIPVRVGGAVRR